MIGQRLRLLPAVTTAAWLLIAAGPVQAAPAGSQWPLDAGHLDGAKVWQVSTGSGVTVAVLDSGVDPRHPDLVGQVLSGADFTGNGTDGRVDLSRDSHGTAIAGIIAGTGRGAGGTGVRGLAPNAKILPIRIAENTTSDPVAMAQGIHYATTHRARVINISLCMIVPNPQVRDAIAFALAHDVIVVAASGNDGQTGNYAQYPAALPGVLAVSGTNMRNEFWDKSQSGDYVALSAPAVDIYSTGRQGTNVTASGTSYAAPFVSAAAALLRSKYPQENARQIIARMTTTADAHGGGRRSPQLGFGVVNPYQALSADPPPLDLENPLVNTSKGPGSPPARPAARVWTTTAVGVTAVAAAAVILLLWLRRRRNLMVSGPPDPARER